MPAPLQLFSFCSPRPATVSAEQDAQNCRDSPAALDARYPAPTTIPLSVLEHIIERKCLFGEPFLQNAAEAFKKVARDELTVAPVQCLGKHSLGRPLAGNADGQCCIKTGYLGGAGGAGAADEEEIFVVKAAGRGALGPTGAMLAFSQKTVQLKTILLDDGMLTSIRTAAAACMASRHFLKRLGYAVLQDGVKTKGRREITKIGLVGGGSQALWNLRFLTYVTSCRDVVLLTRSRESAERFAETLKNSACLLDRAWNVEVCDEGCREKLRECQLFHTCTAAEAAVLGFDDVAFSEDHPVHITALGTDTPGKQELETALVAAADVCAYDNAQQTRERGEFQHFLAGKADMPEDKFVELGALLLLAEERSSCGATIPAQERLTIFDSSGIAAQDVMIAKLVMEEGKTI